MCIKAWKQEKVCVVKPQQALWKTWLQGMEVRHMREGAGKVISNNMGLYIHIDKIVEAQE